MPNKRFSIKDESFNSSILSNHQLSIRISKSILEIAVLNTSQNMIVAFETWNFSDNEDFIDFTTTFKKIEKDSFILGPVYKKVNVIIDTSGYTLIPNFIFQPKDAMKYLEFNYSSASSEAVCIDDIESISVKNIYQVPGELEKVCKRYFPNLCFRNTCTILINSLLNTKEIPESAFVNFSGKRIDVLVTIDGKLRFCNSFSYKTQQDIIYYILNVYQKLGIDTSSLPIVLAGEITQESLAYEIIYRYICNVSFAKRLANIQFCADIKELPGHMYYDLFYSFI